MPTTPSASNSSHADFAFMATLWCEMRSETQTPERRAAEFGGIQGEKNFREDRFHARLARFAGDNVNDFVTRVKNHVAKALDHGAAVEKSASGPFFLRAAGPRRKLLGEGGIGGFKAAIGGASGRINRFNVTRRASCRCGQRLMWCGHRQILHRSKQARRPRSQVS